MVGHDDRDLYTNLQVRCKGLESMENNLQFKICGECASCDLQNHINETFDWFSKASLQTKRVFLIGLARRLTERPLLKYVLQILTPITRKDFTYARSQPVMGLHSDGSTISGDRALDIQLTEEEMHRMWEWFSPASHFAKVNYILYLLQNTEPALLLEVQNQLKLVLSSNRRKFVEKIIKPYYNQLSGEESDSDDSFKSSTDSGIAFLKSVKKDSYTISAKNPFTGKTFSKESRLRKFRRRKTQAKATEKSEKSLLNRRLSIKNNESDETSSEDDNIHPNIHININRPVIISSMGAKYKDIVRDLPVNISKYILNFLNKKTLTNCCKVNKIWKTLAQQVLNEVSIQARLHEQYTVMHDSTAKGCNPQYARDIAVLAPDLIGVNGIEVRRLDGYNPAAQNFSNPSTVDYKSALFGYETKEIFVEEKNIYCGAYNTMILEKRENINRVVHYCGGEMIASAIDKKIDIISSEVANQKFLEKPIFGHAGSIQCIHLVESEGYVITGSYDTTIRCWDIATGACKRIFKGHTDTVFCINKYMQMLVSGSKDSTMKLWNVNDGRLMDTFKCKHAILSIEITPELVIGGDSEGLVEVWSLRKMCRLKSLNGHIGPVHSVHADKWHIVSGGKDGNALLWSTIGNFDRCFGVFRHSKPVLNVYFQDMRIFTGCMDGKLRVWNALTGECIRLLRGNSKAEPVCQMIPVDSKVIINTPSCVLSFTFEQVEYDYMLEEDRPGPIKIGIRPNTPSDERNIYSYTRAQKMIRVGSADARLIQNRSHANALRRGSQMLRRRSVCTPRTKSPQEKEKFLSTPVPDCDVTYPDEGVQKEPNQRPFSASTATSIVVEEQAKSTNRKRRDSSIPGSIQNNEARLSISEAMALLRAEKRQHCSRTTTKDQIQMTVAMIKSALASGEVERNTVKNAEISNINAFEKPKRPDSAPIKYDPSKKVGIANFSKFKPPESTTISELNEIASPKVISRVNPLKKSDIKLNHASIHPSHVPSSIPRPTEYRPKSASYVQNAKQHLLPDRPHTVAKSSITSRISPMLFSPKKIEISRSEDVKTLEKNSSSKNPLAGQSNFELKTQDYWTQCEEDYYRNAFSNRYQNFIENEKLKYKLWLSKAKNC